MKNEEIRSGIRDDVEYFNAEEAPFRIYGVFREGDRFVRLPKEAAEFIWEEGRFLQYNDAGGRVRFRTDSPFVTVYAKYCQVGKMPHFAFTGSIGFDLYKTGTGTDVYVGTFMPPTQIENVYEQIVYTDGKMNDYILNMPLYSGVSELYIGVRKGARLLPGDSYLPLDPVVYYGSSITQGGCASRPGCSYQSIISHRYHLDFINLGFSGSARGEKGIAEYIAGLKMSCFVMDYDYNSPDAKSLEETHEAFFRVIRQAQPELPVVFVTRPRPDTEPEDRTEVILKTYRGALERGDRNVYFVDGSRFTDEESKNFFTVDGCHPNDLGFYFMARDIGNAVISALFRKLAVSGQ